MSPVINSSALIGGKFIFQKKSFTRFALQCKCCNFNQCTEVRFASFLSGRFTTMAVINPPEKKLAKRTSVECSVSLTFWLNLMVKFVFKN